MVNYNSPAQIKAFLESKGFAMQKKFGQNFLVNEDARVSLIDALDINESSYVWEVGPGLGCMTYEILKRGAGINCFEIDKGFAGINREFFDDYAKKGKFSLVEGDVLKTWKKYFKGEENNSKIPDRFFGNLPYNVAATIIADMISEGIRFEKMVVTVQKEVGLRMCAKPGTEDYSSFSVLCQWAYDCKPLMDLAGGNFWPRPNVDSRAVIFTRKENFPGCENPKLFMTLVRALFSSRRKTVKNNIKSVLRPGQNADEIFEKAGISSSERAENMSIEQFQRLSDVLNKN